MNDVQFLVTKCMKSKMHLSFESVDNFCRGFDAKFGAKCIIKIKDPNHRKQFEDWITSTCCREVHENVHHRMKDVSWFKIIWLLRLWTFKEKFGTEQNGYGERESVCFSWNEVANVTTNGRKW
eukprot:295289_1